MVSREVTQYEANKYYKEALKINIRENIRESIIKSIRNKRKSRKKIMTE